MSTDRSDRTMLYGSTNSVQIEGVSPNKSANSLGRAIYKLEEITIPNSIQTSTPSLPVDVDLDRVIRTVYQNLQLKSTRGKQEWFKIYNSKYCTDMICDFYWLFVAKLLRKKVLDLEISALERIASNYVDLYISTPEIIRNSFFLKFADSLAQGVYYALFYSFPKSRSKLTDPDFRRDVFELVASQLTGIPISNEPYLNWKIDLGHGNILTDRRTRSVTRLPALKPKMTKVLDMRYSPLVNRYIRGRHYSRNLVPSCKLKYSKRDILDELDRKDKMEQVKETARSIIGHTARLSEDYDLYSKKSSQEAAQKP